MIRRSALTRQRILGAAYELFYRHGYGRVGVDAIAAHAGVTKRTLYNHFPSKDELVAAALDNQHVQAFAQIRKWGAKAARNPREFLSGIFEELRQWASKPRWLGSGFTRLTMEMADLPGHPVRRAAHLHKTEVESWLREELTRLGANHPAELARQTMVLIEGCLSLILIHGDPGYATAASRAAQQLAEEVGV